MRIRLALIAALLLTVLPLASAAAQDATPAATPVEQTLLGPLACNAEGQCACFEGFIADAGYAQPGDILEAGSTQKSGWIVRNCGSVTWDEFHLAYVTALDKTSWEKDNPELYHVRPVVAPAQQLLLTIEFTTPTTLGLHVVFFSMADGQEDEFGEPLVLIFTVSGGD